MTTDKLAALMFIVSESTGLPPSVAYRCLKEIISISGMKLTESEIQEFEASWEIVLAKDAEDEATKEIQHHILKKGRLTK